MEVAGERTVKVGDTPDDHGELRQIWIEIRSLFLHGLDRGERRDKGIV